MLPKIQKSDIKIPDFRQNFQNTKKITKMFLCIRPHVSKLKNHGFFFYTKKNNILAFILTLITSLLKVKRTLAKISKITKILFCLSFSIRGTNLHVKHIPDIKTIVLL
jgi:hypothetical protein